MTTTCLACGTVSEDDDRFCSSCGAAINAVGEPTGIIPIVANADTTEFAPIANDPLGELAPGAAL